jgi:S-adenosylmethionine:tRNA ribosyltransferase-isomerase
VGDAPTDMKLSDFDYPLPEELIAQAPVTPRDASRLLVLAGDAPPAHRRFDELDRLLAPGDLLVFNDTKVIPARLVGRKASGGKVELLLCEPLEGGLGRRWRAMGQASKPIRAGAELSFDGLAARVDEVEGEGFYVVTLDREGAALEAALATAGRIPLPPYIRREPGPEDRERYQTVWARRPGSAAAPTAGLHFTPEILARLKQRGIETTEITLHVGLGTFQPVRVDRVEDHRLHQESYSISPPTAQALNRALDARRRVVAIGTTTVRTLEYAARAGRIQPESGEAALFIYPGYNFRVVGALLTNFHLPQSTLLMLVCALGGQERVLQAYRHAVAQKYRFYSYGDCMFLE